MPRQRFDTNSTNYRGYMTVGTWMNFNHCVARRMRVPASWQVSYRDGDHWQPVQTTDTYGVALDQWNAIHFQPVTTSAMRLEVKMQPGWSAGIQEWQME